MSDKIEFKLHPTILFKKLNLLINGRMKHNYFIEFDYQEVALNHINIYVDTPNAKSSDYTDLTLAKYDLIQRYYHDLEVNNYAIRPT